MLRSVPAGLRFGEVAEDFDRVRLSYPASLVDDVLGYQGEDLLRLRALEVGAGTGKATVAFVARGVRLVAVEPDAAMAAVLARRVADPDAVEIVTSRFEDYRPAERFGLLACADAWHWVDPEAGWELAARALAPGGVLALFWNHDRIDDDTVRRHLLSVLHDHVPEVRVIDAPSDWPGDELAARPEFTDQTRRVYQSRITMPAADYLTHMSTRSQCRMLAPPVRERLFGALATVFVEPVTLAVDTVLHLARVRP